MTTYDLVNPSDPYTIQGDDLAVLAVATILLGNGHYALVAHGTRVTPQNIPEVVDNLVVPIFMFGTADEWFREHFAQPAVDVIRTVMTEKADALVACLQSVLIGDRADFDTLVAGFAPDSPEWRQAWLAWHDAHRTSSNDIGRRAFQLATKVQRGAITVQA